MEKAADDSLRYENKFPISGFSLQEIEYFIKNNPYHFSEIFEERVINNIYLDTVDLNAYLENKAGLSKREKFRIRWYGDNIYEANSPALEIKVKNGSLGRKWRYSVLPLRLNDEFLKQHIEENLKKSDLPSELHEILLHVQPKLLNQYRRKYFQSLDRKFRITLDWHFIYRNIDTTFQLPLNSYTDCENLLLELKYAVEHEQEACLVTANFPFRMDKNSKYINGIESVFETN